MRDSILGQRVYFVEALITVAHRAGRYLWYLCVKMMKRGWTRGRQAFMVTKGECAHSWISPISNNAVIHTALCIMYTKTSVFKYAMYLMLFLKVTPVKRDISGLYINTLNPLWKWLISISVPKAILQFYKILTFKTVTLFIKR